MDTVVQEIHFGDKSKQIDEEHFFFFSLIAKK